ncbi:hypothetical protein FQN57_001769 [Myotisia sp. PD_48]|nr:hypothetical protein FQN57_001769 [Myotisia sp. PD_48]
MASSVLSLFSLQGKTAVVTGGTRGIGQAMAIGLAEAGADIILVQVRVIYLFLNVTSLWIVINGANLCFDRPITELQRDGTSNTQTRDEIIQKTGRKVTIHVADLADRDAVHTVIPSIVEQGTAIDILVNCAGIQRRHPSEEFPTEDWDEVMQVNLTSVFILCREFGSYVLSRDPSTFANPSRKGTIINVGSLLSFQGGITVPAYAASKGGIAQLTKALSNEWAAKGIWVNSIAPGYIDTEMNKALTNDPIRRRSILERIPAGRWGKPEDFKGVVVFLASDASSYVSGEMICVDGGWMGR